jgi:hypothetical protein
MSNRILALAGAAALLLSATAANAESWTRTHEGPNGGSRTVTGNCGDGHCDRTVQSVGPNGGTRTKVGHCGYHGCRHTVTATGPGGKSWSHSAGVARGPFHGYAYRRVTGPAGNTYVGIHRWRR